MVNQNVPSLLHPGAASEKLGKEYKAWISSARGRFEEYEFSNEPTGYVRFSLWGGWNRQNKLALYAPIVKTKKTGGSGTGFDVLVFSDGRVCSVLNHFDEPRISQSTMLPKGLAGTNNSPVPLFELVEDESELSPNVVYSLSMDPKFYENMRIYHIPMGIDGCGTREEEIFAGMQRLASLVDGDAIYYDPPFVAQSD